MKKIVLTLIIYCISSNIYSQTVFLGQTVTMNGDTLKCKDSRDCLIFEVKEFLRKEGRPKYKEVAGIGYFYYSKKGIYLGVSPYNRDSRNTSHFKSLNFLFGGQIPNHPSGTRDLKKYYKGDIYIEDIVIDKSLTYKKIKETDFYQKAKKDLSLANESDNQLILSIDYKNYTLTFRFYKSPSSQEHLIQSLGVNFF